MTTDEVLPAIAERNRPILPQHMLLINAYLGEANFNASEAGRIAGYVDNGTGSIAVQAHRVLNRANVKAEIERRIDATRLSPDYVVSGLIRNAEQALADKAYGASTSALRELGRILAMFTDRTEIDIKAQVLAVSAELGLEPAELEAEVKRLSEGK